MRLSKERLAYFAGFFDGEGCIYLNKSKKKKVYHSSEGAHTIHCTVTNTYKPALDDFLVFGGKVCLQHRSNSPPHWKDRWLWRASGLTAGRFLTLVTPYLKEKQKRANAALFFCDSIAWSKIGGIGRHLSTEAIQLRRLAIKGLQEHKNAFRGGHYAEVG